MSSFTTREAPLGRCPKDGRPLKLVRHVLASTDPESVEYVFGCSRGHQWRPARVEVEPL